MDDLGFFLVLLPTPMKFPSYKSTSFNAGMQLIGWPKNQKWRLNSYLYPTLVIQLKPRARYSQITTVGWPDNMNQVGSEPVSPH